MGYWLMFGAGVLTGAALAVLLLCALVMASDIDDGEGRGDYRAGGGWH